MKYAALCRKLAERLDRKRPLLLGSGKPETWASGIVRTIGWVNFVAEAFDPAAATKAMKKGLGAGEMPGDDSADLGFKKIAGKGLIFRHSAVRTPFGDRCPQGQDADVEALPEYEEWVEKEWEEFRDVAEE